MDVPPEVIAQMLPELEAQMGYDDDDDDELDSLFPPLPPGRGRKSSKKRKKSFFEGQPFGNVWSEELCKVVNLLGKVSQEHHMLLSSKVLLTGHS